MLALLVAFQISTTNCSSDFMGGLHCTTNTPQPLPPPPNNNWGPAPIYADQDWGAILEKMRENNRSKAIGKMLANGDCAGAEKYALQRGDFPLVKIVREYCASGPVVSSATAPPAPTTTDTRVVASGPNKIRAKTSSGYCLDVPPNYVGTGALNSPALTSAMPRCDHLSAH